MSRKHGSEHLDSMRKFDRGVVAERLSLPITRWIDTSTHRDSTG